MAENKRRRNAQDLQHPARVLRPEEAGGSYRPRRRIAARGDRRRLPADAGSCLLQPYNMLIGWHRPRPLTGGTEDEVPPK
jgi:hypothetical protein